MHRVRNLLQRLASALAALALAVLMAGPSLETLVCHDEISAAATAAGSAMEQAISLDGGAKPHPESSPHQSCVHGHCHHSVQSPPVTVAELSVMQSRSARHAWPTVIRLATLAPSGLERPPRA